MSETFQSINFHPDIEPTPIGVMQKDSTRQYSILPAGILDSSNEFNSILQPLRMTTSQGVLPQNSTFNSHLDHSTQSLETIPYQQQNEATIEKTEDTVSDHPSEEISNGISQNENNTNMTIYNYQQERWMERYQALLNFHVKHGHCNVPYTYKDDPGLVNWVKRQRNQYKCIQQGRRSNLTDERISLLNRIGFFEWNSQEAVWQGNFEKLKQFYATNGHFCVPRTAEKKSLSNWVRRQKRYFVMVTSKDSKLKAESLESYKRRVEQLQGIGFPFS